jgi:hypothetical protein
VVDGESGEEERVEVKEHGKIYTDLELLYLYVT